jgi:predicted nucleic acid-binding protein
MLGCRADRGCVGPHPDPNGFLMVVVIDTSAVVAVLVSEHQRTALVSATAGADLIAPGSVHWEIGNALSALLKRRRASPAQVQQALAAYAEIPLRLLDVDLPLSLELAAEHGLYAYDAHLITCALGQKAPLLTLDDALARAAARAGVRIFEVET